MATLAVPTLIPAPPLPKRGGILAIADVIDVAVPHFVLDKNTMQWPCKIPQRAPGLCWDDSPWDTGTDITPSGLGSVVGTTGGTFTLDPATETSLGLTFTNSTLTNPEGVLFNLFGGGASRIIPVTPGDTYYLDAEFSSGGLTAGRSHGAQWVVQGYDSGGTAVGGLVKIDPIVGGTDWGTTTGQWTVPAGVASAWFYLNSSTAGAPAVDPGFMTGDWFRIRNWSIWLNGGPQPPKVFEGVPWGELFTFALYSGVECYLEADDDYEQRARLGLEAGESAAIEQAINSMLPEPTPGNPIAENIVDAIAWAEQRSSVYVGMPTIWMNRMLATYAIAEQAAFPNLDWSLTTGQGSPIVNGAFDSADTIWWGGRITIWRGPVTVATVADTKYNRGRAIAERIYAVHVECGLQPIQIDSPVGTPGSAPVPLAMLLGSIPSSPIPDGTDTTITVQTNVTPTSEVFLWYAVNGGGPVQAGEMTQVNPHEFVWNVVGDATGPGDSVEVWAATQYGGSTVQSNHIQIDVV